MGGLLMALGGILGLVGWIWLIITAFQTSGAVWGIINIFFQPITGLIFCVMKKTGWKQFGIMVVGWVICIIGASMSGYATGSYSVG